MLVALALLACAALISAHGGCGSDNVHLAQRLSRHTHPRERRASPTVDLRFAVAGSVPTSPRCTFLSNEYGTSQCLIEDVIISYRETLDWPSAQLSLEIVTYAPSSGPGWINSSVASDGMAALNAAFASTGISFAHTLTSQVNDMRFSSLSASPTSFNTLDTTLVNIIMDFGIGTRQATRTSAVYLAVIPLDITDLVGLCFPVPGMLEDASELDPMFGSLCFVTPEFFLDQRQYEEAHPQSFGLTTAHEVGHALGLRHPHQAVSMQIPVVGSNPLRFSGCTTTDEPSGCVATADVYSTGDFIADTPPVPNYNYYNQLNLFDMATCTAGPDYPRVCGSTQSNLTTSVLNYMSYFPENCTNSFSRDQIARMRCVIDRYLDIGTGLITNARRPPPVPLVTATRGANGVEVAWAPPLSLLAYNGSRPSTLLAPAGMSFVITRTPPFIPTAEIVLAVTVFGYVDFTADLTTPPGTYAYQVFARTAAGDGAKSPAASDATAASGASATTLSALTALAVLVACLL